MAIQRKKPSKRHGFRVGEFIVYPSHGVGHITAIEKQQVAGCNLELFVIYFEQERMTLRVPVAKITSVGMRKLSSSDGIETALKIVQGRPRIKRTMWSRRAQEYESKINSGDLNLVAEVVRDLYRASGQPEQSYSERQLFEAAQDRMARELAATRKSTHGEAVRLIEQNLAQCTSRVRGTRPARDQVAAA